MLLLTVVALAALIFASPALAAPGDLDTTFGDDGTVFTRFFDSNGHAMFSPGDDLAIQPDGKVVVAGGESLARHNPDGSLDPSFDGDGKVVTDFHDRYEATTGVALQGDGKIVVIRQFAGRDSWGQLNFDIEVLRYNTDGSPDTSFDGDGRLTTSVGPGNAGDGASDVVVQPDGKIVVGGGSNDGSGADFALVRYNPDGSLDPSFDADGKLTTKVGSDADFAVALALQGDKIVAAGFANNDAGSSDFALARYNSDGSLDTSFDGDGKLTTSMGAGRDAINALAMQPDGKILAAGSSEAVQPKIKDFALARYNPDGSLDTSFDGDGRLTTSVGPLDDALGDVVLQPDGKIVAVGRTTVDRDGYYRNWEIILARYNLNGSLDPLFGGDGKASGPEIAGQNVAAGLKADGKIFVSSTSTNQGQLLARFYGGEDATPTGPVTGLTANVQAHDASLSWTNPTDGEFAATRVVRSTTGFATEAIGGAGQTKVYEGAATSITDANLPEGRYYYTAFARDGNGNYSAAATVRAIVDAMPPNTQVLSGPLGDTNDNKPTFTFNAFDNVSPQADLLYSYKVDGEPWSDYSGATSATVGGTSGLLDGPHTFYVRAKDEAGNEDGSPAERTFTVDTQGPEVTITAGPSGTVSVRTARFEFSSSEAAADFQCKLDDAPDFTFCFSPEDYSNLSDGEHTFRVRGVDGWGNVGSTVSHTWTIAPEITSQPVVAGETVTSDAEGDGATATDPVETAITSPVAGPVSITESADVDQSSAGYSLLGQQVNIEAPASTADNPLRFVFTFDSSLIPAGEDKDTIQIFRNGAQVQNCTDPSSGAASPDPCVLSRVLAGDDIQFTILTSHASAWNFGVDDTPPAPPVISSPANNSYDLDGTITLSGTAEAGSMVSISEGTTLKGTARASTGGGWSKTLSGVANGRHTYTAKATDAANNTSAASAARTVTVDTLKPTISGMSPRHASIIRDTTPTIRATVKDNNLLSKANIKLYVNGRLISATKYSYVPSTGALVYNSPRLVLGKKTVKIVATDAARNVGTKSWYFTIK